jgi:nucleoside 2-deoxyribosyltransferase
MIGIKGVKLFYTYLAGPIELDTSDGGQSWRNTITPTLDDAGISVQDPCKTEPLATGMDVVTAQDQFNRWIKGGRYDLFADKFRDVVEKDMRMVDRSDFIVVHLFPNIGTTGTIHEMARAWRLKKPIYLVYYGAVSSISKWALFLTTDSGGKVFPNKKQLTDFIADRYASKNQHWHTLVIQTVKGIFRAIEGARYESTLKAKNLLKETPEETALREAAEAEAGKEVESRKGDWPNGQNVVEEPKTTTKKVASKKEEK